MFSSSIACLIYKKRKLIIFIFYKNLQNLQQSLTKVAN